MRWADVDIGVHQITDDNGRSYSAAGTWWTLPAKPSDDGSWPGTKNGQTHRVWLSEPTVQILEEIREELQSGQQTIYTFTGRTGGPIPSLDCAMRSICNAMGIQQPDKVTPHDLRRTHGTTITSLRFTHDQMNRIQNHIDGGIASVFDRHGYQHESRIIQEALAERLMALVRGQLNNNVVRLEQSM